MGWDFLNLLHSTSQTGKICLQNWKLQIRRNSPILSSWMWTAPIAWHVICAKQPRIANTIIWTKQRIYSGFRSCSDTIEYQKFLWNSHTVDFVRKIFLSKFFKSFWPKCDAATPIDATIIAKYQIVHHGGRTLPSKDIQKNSTPFSPNVQWNSSTLHLEQWGSTEYVQTEFSWCTERNKGLNLFVTKIYYNL